MSIYKLLVWWISGIYRWSMYHHRCVQLLAMLWDQLLLRVWLRQDKLLLWDSLIAVDRIGRPSWRLKTIFEQILGLHLELIQNRIVWIVAPTKRLLIVWWQEALPPSHPMWACPIPVVKCHIRAYPESTGQIALVIHCVLLILVVLSWHQVAVDTLNLWQILSCLLNRRWYLVLKLLISDFKISFDSKDWTLRDGCALLLKWSLDLGSWKLLAFKTAMCLR